MVARLPETVNSCPVNEPDPSSVIIGGKPGRRSTLTSRVVNSPCRLSRGRPRLCAIASMSAAVQLAFIDPCRRPPWRFSAHHSRTSGLMNCGHRRMRSDVALGPASMASLSEEPSPSGAVSALTATSTVGPRAVRRSTKNWDVGSRKRASNTIELKADRVGAGPFRTELRAAQLKMRAPHPRRIGRRGDPASRLDMRQSGENLKPVDAKPPRGFVPGHGAACFIDKKRRSVGVVDSHPSGADGEPASEIPQRRIGRKLCVELERDRALGGKGRRLPVERLEVGEAEVAPLDRKGRRIAVRRLRHDFPRSRRTGRRDRGVRARARMIECDGEVVVDDGALRRLVFDFEMAAGERQPVERLGGAGHAFGGGADEGGKPGGVSVRGRRPRQRDRGRARIAGDRKRQRAVAGDAQAQVEPIEFKPAHPDVHQRQGEGIEANASARRGKDGVAGGVAHGEALEAEAHAPRIMHEVGRSERDGVTVADALLEGDPGSGRACRPDAEARAPAARPAGARRR